LPPAFVFSAYVQLFDWAGRTNRNLARTRAQGRTRAERTRAHSEPRAERRGNGAQKIPAARAAAIVDNGTSSVGPEPVTTRIAQRVDALHGESGQILHTPSLYGHQLRGCQIQMTLQKSPWAARTELLGRILPLRDCGVK
jgi:hypothetical protein